MVLFRSTKEATDYILAADRLQGEDGSVTAKAGAVTFSVRCLPLRLGVYIMETVPRDFGAAFELAIRAGIRWRGGDGDWPESKHETKATAVCGQAVDEPLTAECYNVIPANVAQELFREVIAANRLRNEDVGN